MFKMENEKSHKENEQNGKLMSEFGITRRQSRSLYRNWGIHSKKSGGASFQSQSSVFGRISSSTIGNDISFNKESSSTFIEDRAEEIVRHMEQTQNLMNDDPKSNNERIETLREMTEYLTLKRSVKRKLIKSIGSSGKTLGFFKRLKYRMSILLFKVLVTIKNFLNSCELWYSSLKVIEGHLGSSVASYFKFLRKLFLLNACIFTFTLLFIMIPQLLFRFLQYIDDNNNITVYEDFSLKNDTTFKLNFLNDGARAEPILLIKSNPYYENDEFRLGNIFTGEGFLTNTILFYGYYTNSSLTLIEGHNYNIPASYFFTCTFCYILIFFFLFISVAVSYRKCYIEASGGVTNTFSNKILCGWDFGIATKQAAELKSMNLYTEIKELLDDLSKPKKKKTCLNTFYTTAISFSLNGILLFLLCIGGMYSWKYLDQQLAKADTATTMMVWLILTLVIAIAPVLFSLIAHLEGFESPSSALYMTLFRTFTLYTVVVAVVMGYRLNRTNDSECWETILGQDMYRLVVLDFIFGLMGTVLSEFIRYRIYVKMWKRIGCPEFDIARSTMNLIYNQTLFYIGLYFSPVLSLVVTLKLFITFYIKKWAAIYNCKPFVKPWKASQAHTVYLSIAFLAFFFIVIAYGYIITSVKTSNCGPFRGRKFMYESLLEDILSNRDSTILIGFYYITRPGVVGVVLMAMLLGVYYMRAVALARIHVVNHLRHLLRLKTEDKKLLLIEISKYSKEQNCPMDKENKNELRKNFVDLEIKLSKPLKTDENLIEQENSNGEQFIKPVIKFSSLTNLQNESENNLSDRPNRNRIFGSFRNIENFYMETKNTNKKDQTLKEGFVEEVQTSVLEQNEIYAKEHFKDGEEVTFVENIIKPKVIETNNLKNNTAILNFNPIFTESCSLQSNDEENIKSSNDRKIMSSAVPECKANESELEIGNDDAQIIFIKNNHFEERIPSRISFNSYSDKKKSRKKKYQ